MGTHTVRYGMRLRMTNVCLVSMPSNSDLHFRAYIRFFCNEELAAISILVPEEVSFVFRRSPGLFVEKSCR